MKVHHNDAETVGAVGVAVRNFETVVILTSNCQWSEFFLLAAILAAFSINMWRGDLSLQLQIRPIGTNEIIGLESFTPVVKMSTPMTRFFHPATAPMP